MWSDEKSEGEGEGEGESESEMVEAFEAWTDNSPMTAARAVRQQSVSRLFAVLWVLMKWNKMASCWTGQA
jgi:hypothetical protein